MPELMTGGLISTIFPVTGVDQNACATRRRHRRTDLRLLDRACGCRCERKLQLHQGEQVLDRALSKPQPVPQILRIVIRLRPHVARRMVLSTG